MTNTTNISHIGAVRWHLCLCLLLAWIIVFLCIVKGIQSSTKVSIFFSCSMVNLERAKKTLANDLFWQSFS